MTKSNCTKCGSEHTMFIDKKLFHCIECSHEWKPVSSEVKEKK